MKYNFHQHGKHNHDKENGHYFVSLCKGCGKTKAKKPFQKVFAQVSWFRGDDEYLGIYCSDCVYKEVYKLNQ